MSTLYLTDQAETDHFTFPMNQAATVNKLAMSIGESTFLQSPTTRRKSWKSIEHSGAHSGSTSLSSPIVAHVTFLNKISMFHAAIVTRHLAGQTR